MEGLAAISGGFLATLQSRPPVQPSSEVIRNLFTDSSVVCEDFTKGALVTAKGVGLPQPWPLFDGWVAHLLFPPDGLNIAYTRFCWVHEGKVYVFYYDTTSVGRVLGQYSVVGDPPTHCTVDDSVNIGDMFAGAYYGNRGIYDPVEEAVYLTMYYPAALTGIVGKWKMSNWPFTAGNAEWIAVDSSYGAYEAGKIAYLVNTMTFGDGKLFLSSYYSGSVLTVDAATGNVLGEWAYDPNYRYVYRFNLIGFDAANKRPVGGGYLTAAGGGALKTWDVSDPNSWVAVDTVLQNLHVGNKGAFELFGSTDASLYGGAPNYYTFEFNPNELSLLDYLPTGTLLWQEAMSSYATAGGIYEANLNGIVYHRHAAPSAGRLAGLSGNSGTIINPRIVNISGAAYLFQLGAGSPKILDANPANEPWCPYFQHADEGIYTNRFTATQSETPKKLLIDLHASARNREFSAHPGKHAFRMNINGGAWTDWRAGYELLRLDEVVNGKAAWPAYTTGQVIRIQHKMTAGLFRHLLPPVYTEESGEPGEELASLFDAGAPKEVQPVLIFEPPPLKSTNLAPLGTSSLELTPQGRGVEELVPHGEQIEKVD